MMEHADERRGASISDEAAEWMLRVTADDLSMADRHAFLQWLKISPAHIAEFLGMCGLYLRLHAHKPPPYWIRTRMRAGHNPEDSHHQG